MKPASGSGYSSHNRLRLIVIYSVMALTGITTHPQATQADEPFPAAMATYPTGIITAVYESAFQINGRTVSLAPEAALVDRHGDPLPLTAIRVDIEVKYRIQKGTTDKIDWMLLILPK